MTTATIDEFDLDIQVGVIDPAQVFTPLMGTSSPHSEPCCSDWTCPVDCMSTAVC
jgi:hypothetical protein